ncbi:MAG: hypothetical protein ACI4QA_01620 [Candidatus Spyradosoma sp.]
MLDIVLILFVLKKNLVSDARRFIERAADDTTARKAESSGFCFKMKFFLPFLTKTAKNFFQKKNFSGVFGENAVFRLLFSQLGVGVRARGIVVELRIRFPARERALRSRVRGCPGLPVQFSGCSVTAP